MLRPCSCLWVFRLAHIGEAGSTRVRRLHPEHSALAVPVHPLLKLHLVHLQYGNIGDSYYTFNSCLLYNIFIIGLEFGIFKFAGYLGFSHLHRGLVYRGVGSGLLTKLWLWPTDRKTPDVQPTANSYNLHVIAIIWDFAFRMLVYLVFGSRLSQTDMKMQSTNSITTCMWFAYNNNMIALSNMKSSMFILHICHFFYTTTIWGLIILHFEARKCSIKVVSRQNSVN